MDRFITVSRVFSRFLDQNKLKNKFLDKKNFKSWIFGHHINQNLNKITWGVVWIFFQKTNWADSTLDA